MSIDREKVIKGLQCCQNIDVICMDISCYEPEFSECPYHGMEEGCVATLAKDALELLKEQDCNYCGTVFDVAYKAGKADAVVRCKDCKNSEPWYGDKSRCFLWHETGIDVFNDGFCNYGERQEGR